MAPTPLADLGAGLSTKSPQDVLAGPAPHGTISQTERAFTAASTFLSGVMAISATQFMGAPLKMIDPKFYEAYMAFTKQSFGVLITTMTQWWAPTIVRISGDRSIPKQLFHKPDGTLECRFPKRLVMMANHQLYTDWLYLWWIAYTNNMHGYIYIILKESLKNIPIIGWGAQFYNFIFLKRKWEEDKKSFQDHLSQLSNPDDPMWLLIFPEGTNLAEGTKQKSKEWAEKTGVQDMKHQLLPRSKGLQFCLQNLENSTEWLYDCTIGYEGIPPGQFGQDVFTLRSSMFEGRPPKSVNMHFRRFKIADIPVNNDKSFELWLRNRWREKDYLLEHFAQYNRFPEDDKWLIKQQNTGKKGPVPAKSIETQIKSNSLGEFLSIFAPMSSVATALSLFYGDADPSEVLKMIGEAAQQQQTVADVRDDESTVPAFQPRKPRAKSTVSGTTMSNAKKAPSGTTAKAKQNMVQQYVNAIRPAATKQIQLPDRALRIANAGKGEASIRSNQKPGNLVQKKFLQGKAATDVPEKSKPVVQQAKQAPKRAESLTAANPTRPAAVAVKKPVIVKPTTAPKRPSKQRTFSTASTIRPSDSISAVNVGGIKTKAAPKSEKKPVLATGTPRPVKPIEVVKNNGITPKAGNAGAKSVSIDPAMLMKMKFEKQKAVPKGVNIDPAILVKMKEAKKG